MRVAVDVMSGDNPAEELIKGALSAAKDFGIEVVLIGAPEAVDRYADDGKGIYVKHAASVVTMEDNALAAIKDKDDSSVAVAAMLLKNNEADALVSAGNTGALISTASIRVRRVKGIRRAAIGTVVPLDKPFIIVDAGANTEVLPENLVQFAANLKNLPVITCGEIPPNPTELLSSRRMEILLETLKKGYDYIVIDLPPVSAVSDALIVSKMTDGIIVVARQDYVDKNLLEDTIRQLKFNESHIIGLVLNGARTESRYYYKYKYRKYAKAYGYGAYERAKPGEKG